MARLADPAMRDKLLQAARTVFAEKGFSKATMSEIAQRAGVAHGTTYLYFKSKEALAAALTGELNQKFLQVALPALSQPDLKTGIADCVRAFFALCQAERDVLQILYVTLGVAQVESFQSENEADALVISNYLGLFAERMARGEMQRYEDAQSLFVLLVGLFNWVALQAFAAAPMQPSALDSLEATLVHLLQRALLP